MRNFVAICAMMLLPGVSYVNADCVPLNSGASQDTYPMGINGSSIHSSYHIDNDWHDFFCDGTKWKTFDYPEALGNTYVFSFSKNNVVGINKDNVLSASLWHGFIYNRQTWPTLDHSGATENTHVCGISDSNIIVFCAGSNNGFLYDGGIRTNPAYPNAAGVAKLNGIGGNNVAGTAGAQGFFYNDTNWATLNYPGTSQKTARNIRGNFIIVEDLDSLVCKNGFISTISEIPEPATLLLLGLGAVMFRKQC